MSKPRLIACIWCDATSETGDGWKDVAEIFEPAGDVGWTHLGVCPDENCREMDQQMIVFLEEQS